MKMITKFVEKHKIKIILSLMIFNLLLVCGFIIMILYNNNIIERMTTNQAEPIDMGSVNKLNELAKKILENKSLNFTDVTIDGVICLPKENSEVLTIAKGSILKIGDYKIFQDATTGRLRFQNGTEDILSLAKDKDDISIFQTSGLAYTNKSIDETKKHLPHWEKIVTLTNSTSLTKNDRKSIVVLSGTDQTHQLTLFYTIKTSDGYKFRRPFFHGSGDMSEDPLIT